MTGCHRLWNEDAILLGNLSIVTRICGIRKSRQVYKNTTLSWVLFFTRFAIMGHFIAILVQLA